MVGNDLTERECVVLYYLTKGLTNKQIGRIMNLSPHTIKAHVSSILGKMKCPNRTSAASIAQAVNITTLHQD